MTELIKKLKIKIENGFREVPLGTEAKYVSVPNNILTEAVVKNVEQALSQLNASTDLLKQNYINLANATGERLTLLKENIDLIEENNSTFLDTEFSPLKTDVASLKESADSLTLQTKTLNNKIGAIPDQFSSVMDAVKNINIAVGIDADKDYIWTDDVVPVFDRLDSLENHVGLGLTNPTNSLYNKVNDLGTRVSLLESTGGGEDVDLSDVEMRLMSLESTYSDMREAMAKMENVYVWKTGEFQTWKDQTDAAQIYLEQELGDIKDAIAEIQAKLA